MQAGAGGFADGPQAGERGAAMFVRGDAAHVVMRGRADGDGLRGGIDAAGLAKLGDGREAGFEALAQAGAGIEEYLMARDDLAPDVARDDIARGEFVAGNIEHEAAAGFIEQNGAFAAYGLGNQRHGIEPDGECRGVELDEFHVGHHRAGAGGEGEAAAGGGERVGGGEIEPADAAAGDDDLVAGDDDLTVGGIDDEAGDFAVAGEDAPRDVVDAQFDVRTCGDADAKRADDFEARGIAAGVDDAAVGVGGFETQGQIAVGIQIERDAVVAQCLDRGRAGGGDAGNGVGIAQTVAGGQRVDGVGLGAVIGADGGGDAALGPGAGGGFADLGGGE